MKVTLWFNDEIFQRGIMLVMEVIGILIGEPVELVSAGSADVIITNTPDAFRRSKTPIIFLMMIGDDDEKQHATPEVEATIDSNNPAPAAELVEALKRIRQRRDAAKPV